MIFVIYMTIFLHRVWRGAEVALTGIKYRKNAPPEEESIGN